MNRPTVNIIVSINKFWQYYWLYVVDINGLTRILTMFGFWFSIIALLKPMSQYITVQ